MSRAPHPVGLGAFVMPPGIVNTSVVLPNRLLDFVNARFAAPVGASREMTDAIVERLLAGTP